MTNYDKLQKILTELFQLDKAELDFGIYRIMNQKRDDVLDFLENKLPKEVREILESKLQVDATALKKNLDEAIKMAKEFGLDPDTTPKVQEARTLYESAGSITALEQEVFSHLASFFKRYYQDGDFISLRRYKKDVYAIPYEGEEVKLHWANHDQYYIKTSENLKNYAFKIDGDKTIRFTLKEANTEQNNNKIQNDQERRFDLYEEEPITIDGDTLHLNFTYEPHKKTVKQDKLLEDAVSMLTSIVPTNFAKIFSLAPTEKNKKRTLLEKHLNDFSARNTFDYFIHKDLGGFLTRELDFYIKNEVLFIDDINTENEQAFNTQLSKIRALKQVAQKIITFLAQIENFQKKLWLKKKFVISCDYCITLDRIPEKYYAEISKNKKQLEEWKALFNVTIKNEAELKDEPFLVLDTKFFSQEFKDKLLSEFDDLDEQTNGVLINSDNFQAISTINTRYKESVNTIYIDPPYNTGDDGFVYKDSYKHSSWIAFINDRLKASYSLMSIHGKYFLSIDDKESTYLQLLLKEIFGSIKTIAVKMSEASGVKMASVIKKGTIPKYKEYLLVASKGQINNIYFDLLNKKEWDSEYNKFVDNFSKDLRVEIKTKSENCSIDELKDINNQLKSADLISVSEAFRIYNDKQLDIDAWRSQNAWRIVRTAASTSVFKLAKENRINQNVFSVLSNRDNIIYLIDGNFNESSKAPRVQFLFADDNLQVHPGDFWSDISTTGLEAEGDTDFKNGKKPLKLINRVLNSNKEQRQFILDYFAGSGTTGHATIKLNKEDNGNRKYILVEMGEYFNSVTKLRIQKVIYTDNWKNGKPQDKEGISQMFKYFNLESYEDTLNNLQLIPNQVQQQVLDTNTDLQEEYLLQYMLDVESREHLMNIEAFKNPFDYKLKVTENNELIPTTVDLVETFNYLIGLHVKRIQRTGVFKTVEGITNRGDKVLVIWRNLEESNNEDLNKFVKKMDYNLRDGEFDTIYVNGDNNLANLKNEEETWKVLLLEEVFFTEMFDVKDV